MGELVEQLELAIRELGGVEDRLDYLTTIDMELPDDKAEDVACRLRDLMQQILDIRLDMRTLINQA